MKLSSLLMSLFACSNLAVISSNELASANQRTNKLYQSCLRAANDSACAQLGIDCGARNSSACNALNKIGQIGYVRIQQYCFRGQINACNFKITVDRLGGPRGLVRLGSSGNQQAFSALTTIRCYATEAATGARCLIR